MCMCVCLCVCVCVSRVLCVCVCVCVCFVCVCVCVHRQVHLGVTVDVYVILPPPMYSILVCHVVVSVLDMGGGGGFIA